MLILTLTAITDPRRHASIVERRSLGSVPPSVTYHLTDIGEQPLPALEGLFKWGHMHMEMTALDTTETDMAGVPHSEDMK